jgi:hypothetical protein
MFLPRLQLFELEDFPWFPATIRDLSTDYLRFMQSRLSLHVPMLPVLREALQFSGTDHIVDLCSGGGGPVAAVVAALNNEGTGCRATLTDKYPNLSAFQQAAGECPGYIGFIPEPVNADDVPKTLIGLRTIFNGFHHFSPALARRVLANAVDAGQPIAILELPERTIVTIVPFFLTPLYIFLVTPWIRPFKWRRILWTYLLPAVPLLCWWDGIVSALRAYTPIELLELTAEFSSFQWKSGQIPLNPFGHVTYLTGLPAYSEDTP